MEHENTGYVSYTDWSDKDLQDEYIKTLKKGYDTYDAATIDKETLDNFDEHLAIMGLQMKFSKIANELYHRGFKLVKKTTVSVDFVKEPAR